MSKPPFSTSSHPLTPFSPFSPPSPFLSHLNRLLSSTSGQDKLFMLYAYSAHILTYLLRHPKLGTLWSLKAQKRRTDLAERIGKLQSVVGDARVLYRLFGIFPIISWAQSLNSPNSAPTDTVQWWIQLVQVWSMLIYYPLEHWYYLAGKGVFKLKPEKSSKIATWSCRFWALYVILQIAHITRSHTLLNLTEHQLIASRKEKLQAVEKVTPGDVEHEKKELKKLSEKRKELKRDGLVQAGYLPLTMHWSLPNGLLPDNVYVGICGTVAAVFGLQGVWKATA